jgi:hypothetical protein
MVTNAKNEKANAFGGKLKIMKIVCIHYKKTKSWIYVETYGNAYGTVVVYSIIILDLLIVYVVVYCTTKKQIVDNMSKPTGVRTIFVRFIIILDLRSYRAINKLISWMKKRQIRPTKSLQVSQS